MKEKLSKIFVDQKKKLIESFIKDNDSWENIVSFIKIYKNEFDKFLDTENKKYLSNLKNE